MDSDDDDWVGSAFASNTSSLHKADRQSEKKKKKKLRAEKAKAHEQKLEQAGLNSKSVGGVDNVEASYEAKPRRNADFEDGGGRRLPVKTSSGAVEDHVEDEDKVKQGTLKKEVLNKKRKRESGRVKPCGRNGSSWRLQSGRNGRTARKRRGRLPQNL